MATAEKMATIAKVMCGTSRSLSHIAQKSDCILNAVSALSHKMATASYHTHTHTESRVHPQRSLSLFAQMPIASSTQPQPFRTNAECILNAVSAFSHKKPSASSTQNTKTFDDQNKCQSQLKSKLFQARKHLVVQCA